jgi:RNA polymerase sigma factor (sigma-70 family)
MDRKLINGEMKSRDEAVLDNLGLVRKLANSFLLKAKKADLDFEDMESIGVIGLLKAFDEFEPERGYKFSTYACPKIIGEFRNSFRMGHEAGMRYPDNIRQKAIKVKKLGIEALPPEKVAERLGITVKSAELTLEFILSPVPVRLDSHYGNDEDTPMYEVIGKTEDRSSAVVNDFLRYCTKKEQEAVNILMAGGTHKEISSYWGNTRSAAWPTIKKVRSKLIRYMNEEKIHLKQA